MHTDRQKLRPNIRWWDQVTNYGRDHVCKTMWITNWKLRQLQTYLESRHFSKESGVIHHTKRINRAVFNSTGMK